MMKVLYYLYLIAGLARGSPRNRSQTNHAGSPEYALQIFSSTSTTTNTSASSTNSIPAIWPKNGLHTRSSSTSGNKISECLKANSDMQTRISNTIAASAAWSYCAELIAQHTVITPTSMPPMPWIEVGDGAANGPGFIITVAYKEEACPKNRTQTALDFPALGQAGCVNYMYDVFNTFCKQKPMWDSRHVVLGDAVWKDCAIWSIAFLSASHYVQSAHLQDWTK